MSSSPSVLVELVDGARNWDPPASAGGWTDDGGVVLPIAGAMAGGLDRL
jgi:hypothetical protein